MQRANRLDAASTTTGRARRIAFECVLGPLACLAFSGCATVSYHDRSFTPVATDPVEVSGDVEVRVVQQQERERDALLARGYELVGYSHFVSPLAPAFAQGDARRTARARGATIALMSPPVAEKMNQHQYLTTFWRPAAGFVLGAYYIDLPPALLGAAGCERNAVIVTAVVEGSPAASLGVAPGNFLVAIDGDPIRSAAFLDGKLLEKTKPPCEPTDDGGRPR